ncbi:Alpha/Beta hydrolase protein [Annulohypoxylon maeteangense]|uniref:Alpha/Beta hydrolase protein n=1 Tax=Annulohypoxylon maeteangense TaxID=1927788 RepID=UPI0020076C3A|nr:Alpha/Beta hydrolase protein [Annulohypoxylon maeteangense]KAI0883453.1 Alpha/Beta hydrolase protein [Annulohypoxylon maeteangense]
MGLPNTIPSPLSTLIPFITREEAAELAYPPNALPGARDVDGFYGRMRVYEWGPEEGKKVLFVHGDATPCLIFSKIAQGMVDAGYRVMLFDLWGRGYSDTPLECRHDDRLFASQISSVLLSSPISWTGNGNTFSIVAFSLGGPIAMTFANAFSSSIQSVVLLGPAGMMRKLPKGYDIPTLLDAGIASSNEERYENVREILGVSPKSTILDVQREKQEDPGVEECPDRVEKTYDMQEILQWQFDYHQGHVHSFQDTMRYGPLMNQEETWARFCNILSGHRCPESPLFNTRLLLIFGEDDDIVVGKELLHDLEVYMAPDKMEAEYVPGGHGFPYPNSEKITQIILSFWGSKASKSKATATTLPNDLSKSENIIKDS